MKYFRTLLNSYKNSRWLKLASIIVFAGIATYLLVSSHAATPVYTAQFEAESGASSGNTSSGYDAVASSGGFLQLGGTAPTAGSGVVSVILTTGDKQKLLSNEAPVSFSAGIPSGANIIHVDAATTYQTIDGFGAAMTDSSAIDINHLPATTKSALMTKLFDPNNGIGISYVRIPMGSSDFAASNYSYDEIPAGQTDLSLSNFSIAHDMADIIPLLKQAKSLNPSLKLIATTWSAPGWMKSTGSMIGGTLNTADYQAFANYYVKFIQAYAAQGLTIDAIAPQNEPGFSPAGYPGMLLSASQEMDLVGHYMKPALTAASLSTRIIGYDHNWDLPSYPTSMLSDATAGPALSGTAWHCYGGTPDVQTTVHNAFPTKQTYLTECSGGDWSPDFTGNLNWDMTNLFIGGLRNWAQGVNLWNLALDTNDGPTNGGCTTCRGVITVSTGSTNVSAYNIEYYVIGQTSKVIHTGAIRIASDSSTNLETVAALNTDGSYGMVVHNSTSTATSFSVVVPGNKWFSYVIPANAVVSFKW